MYKLTSSSLLSTNITNLTKTSFSTRVYKLLVNTINTETNNNYSRLLKYLNTTEPSHIINKNFGKDYLNQNQLFQIYENYNFDSDIMLTVSKYQKIAPEIFNNQKLTLNAFMQNKHLFIPKNFEKYSSNYLAISSHLINNKSFTPIQTVDILVANTKLLEEHSAYTIENIDFICTKFDNSTIHSFPKLINVSQNQYTTIFDYLVIYERKKSYTQIHNEDIDDYLKDVDNIHKINQENLVSKKITEKILNENPLVLTSDTENIRLLLETLLFLTARIPGPDRKFKNKQKIPENNVIQEIPDFSKLDFISQNPYILINSYVGFKKVFELLEKELNINNIEVFSLMKQYPDLMIINKGGLFEKKLDLILKMEIDRVVLKSFIMEYPYVLLKSYNSYVKKYNLLKGKFKILTKKIENLDSIDSNEISKDSSHFAELDLYPYILLFNYAKELKPKIYLLEKYSSNSLNSYGSSSKSDVDVDTDASSSSTSASIMSIPEAFSISKDEFCERLGIDNTEYDFIIREEKYNNTYDLEERDLMFNYNRYLF